MKIPTFVLTYFDTEIIQQTLDNLIKNDQLELHIVENASETTPLNKLFCLNLLKEKRIASYSLMDENISINALELILLDSKAKIEAAEFVLITDGDMTVQDPLWLQEEINILRNEPTVFSCGIRLSLENLPIHTFPEADKWVPPPIQENNLYTEQLSGVHLLLIRSKDFLSFIDYMLKRGKSCLDAELHQYCYQILQKKWAITKKAQAYHLTWDRYADLNHPYVKKKLSKSFDEAWRHHRYCSYQSFYLENGEVVQKKHKIWSHLRSLRKGVRNNIYRRGSLKQKIKSILPAKSVKLLVKLRNKIKNSFKTSVINQRKLCCPICQNSSESFIPLNMDYISSLEKNKFWHGLDKFETLELLNHSCPHCNSSDRERLYALYLNKIQRKSEKLKMLEIAPPPAFSNWIRQQNKYLYRTCDLYMENVDDKVDITEMKEYPDESFDCLVCSHVLEHVSDDKKAVKELYRILAPKGWAIIMVPISLMIQETREDPSINSEEDRWQHYAQNDHVRLYSKNGFIQLLKDGGFKVETFSIADFDDYAFHNHGIDSKSILYIARK